MDVQVYKHTFVSKNAAQRVKMEEMNEWMNNKLMLKVKVGQTTTNFPKMWKYVPVITDWELK